MDTSGELALWRAVIATAIDDATGAVPGLKPYERERTVAEARAFLFDTSGTWAEARALVADLAGFDADCLRTVAGRLVAERRFTLRLPTRGSERMAA